VSELLKNTSLIDDITLAFEIDVVLWLFLKCCTVYHNMTCCNTVTADVKIIYFVVE